MLIKVERIVSFRCRDIGYGIEEGEVILPALDNADWCGKKPYWTPSGDTVYLFDDELEVEGVG